MGRWCVCLVETGRRSSLVMLCVGSSRVLGYCAGSDAIGGYGDGIVAMSVFIIPSLRCPARLGCSAVCYLGMVCSGDV